MQKNYDKMVVDRGMVYAYRGDELIFIKSMFDIFKSSVDTEITYLEGPHNDMKSFKKLKTSK